VPARTILDRKAGMNIGLRSILILAAVILFIIAIFVDENWTDLVALGLAAFAASFVADDFVGGGGFGRVGDRDRT
jgi:hypothetical protein